MTILKRLLALEPVAVQGVVRLAFVLLASLGVTISDATSGQVLAAIAAAYALVEAATTLWARSKSTPTVLVDQVKTPDGAVVAGPASWRATGTPVPDPITYGEHEDLTALRDTLPSDVRGRHALTRLLDEA